MSTISTTSEALKFLRDGWDGDNSEQAITAFEVLDKAGTFTGVDKGVEMIPLEADPEMFREGDAKDEFERLTMAVVSTAYNLLADSSVRVSMMLEEKRLNQHGVLVTLDEGFFRVEGGPKSPREVAPRCEEQFIEVTKILTHLVRESTERLQQASTQAAVNILVDEMEKGL